MVTAVYSGAVNIELGAGYLLSLVTSPRNMSALALRVASLPVGEAAVGAVATLFDDLLTIHTSDGVRFDLSGASHWNHEMKVPPRVASKCIAEGLLAPLTRLGSPAGLLPVVAEVETNPFADRARKVLDEASHRAIEEGELFGLDKLVGLGPGLTPSGDDFIAGVFFARALLRGATKEGNSSGARTGARSAARDSEGAGDWAPEIDTAAIWQTFPRTTIGGRTLLRMVLVDYFPAYLLRLAEGLTAACAVDEGTVFAEDTAAEAGATFGEVVGDTVRHGATSGTDALAGALWYAALSGAAGAGCTTLDVLHCCYTQTT